MVWIYLINLEEAGMSRRYFTVLSLRLGCFCCGFRYNFKQNKDFFSFIRCVTSLKLLSFTDDSGSGLGFGGFLRYFEVIGYKTLLKNWIVL